jgi:hypothetical protein
MKTAIAAFLVLAVAAAGVALAQEGSGHGPPSSPIIMPSPLPAPQTASPALPKLAPLEQQ